ncbi:MAG: YbhB/YbcL family Raf kinase inhibitor-like protein [Nitrospira sp.]|nr:MAG: YbhB/YbcL family Raf kinase inhibitor-like protein [Nitrospira sp.]
MKPTWSIVLLAIALMPGISAAADFQLASPTIKPKQMIGKTHVFDGFGCTGDNVSPELRWNNAPKGTKSFAVTMYDPDAPTGSGWWHWVIFNIPPDISALAAGAGKPGGSGEPQRAVQSTTDFGQPGYGGPCPPPGHKPHRYIFRVFALKVDQLPLKPEASGAMVGYYLNQNALAKASFTGLYSRK